MDEVSRVREKIDIVELISQYIPLKKAGRNFKAPCPFHNEKSPSFVVSPERQIWHCFGCGKGGDAFTFLMEYENMEFVEALRHLAKKAGIVLLESGFDPGIASKKEKIYSINKLALDFYQYLLTKHNVGKAALDYLIRERKLTPAIINTFSLGFSPSIGNALCNYLINKKKYKREDLIDAGLATYQNARLVDFFRGRIMFPLFDHRDNVVGFAARVLKTQDVDGSKYINSRETLVYHKGEMFFGLNIAKEEVKKQEQAIIVEGELDAIACFMQGVKNAIAIKGTALTEKQAILIGRFAPKVSLCLDMDSAGFEATKRSLPILEKAGLTTTVIVLEDGKDPDDAAREAPIAFKKAIKEDLGIYDFMLSKFVEKFSTETVEGKKKITDEMLPLIANIQNEIVKEHYIKKLSREIDTSVESLFRQMEKVEKKDKTSVTIDSSQKDKRGRKEVVEEYLMALIFQSQDVKKYFNIMLETLPDYEFEKLSYKKIIDKMKTSQGLNVALPKELTATYDIWMLLPLPKFEDSGHLEDEIYKKLEELKIMETKKKKAQEWKTVQA
ncbi:MAG: DNA primase [Candidatus Levyibacteriota bacterium]